MTNLWNSLTVEMRQEVDQVEVLSRRVQQNKFVDVRRPLLAKHTLKEEGTVVPNALGSVWFPDGCTVGGSVDGTVFGVGRFDGWHLFVC